MHSLRVFRIQICAICAIVAFFSQGLLNCDSGHKSQEGCLCCVLCRREGQRWNIEEITIKLIDNNLTFAFFFCLNSQEVGRNFPFHLKKKHPIIL